jgi:hypothetical protein
MFYLSKWDFKTQNVLLNMVIKHDIKNIKDKILKGWKRQVWEEVTSMNDLLTVKGISLRLKNAVLYILLK